MTTLLRQFGGGIGPPGQGPGQTGSLFERISVVGTAPGMNMGFAVEFTSGVACLVSNLYPNFLLRGERRSLLDSWKGSNHINCVAPSATANGVCLVYGVVLRLR